ncbi:MAG: hypothetical protein JWN14_3481 [Chthonomonadales bacterium]|nr:hypothetical protein [Chthonomonadales bacterium]
MSYTTLNRLPALGVSLAVVFLILAASRFPGGYQWNHHFISVLFWPITPGGDPNPARPLAVVGVIFFCLGMALLFHLMSSRTKTTFHKKIIQTGGIGSMVYGSIAVTPLHDLMVTISLGFFLAAVLAILHLLSLQRNLRLLSLGILCLVVLLTTAVLYYNNPLFAYLPVAQKTTFVLCTAWLFAVQYANRSMNSGEEKYANAA